ncbi:MAG TPA: SBBP repeat-containing protein [Terriglobales bacterium]|nr:SBBP repeat-containing protein [Terriglobales bacterium]
MTKMLFVFLVISTFSLPLFAQSVDTAWVRTYNGPANDVDACRAITVDRLGNVHVTGSSTAIGTGEDYATIRYYPNGDTAWVRRYNYTSNSQDRPSAIIADSSDNVYVTGGTGTVKYDSSGNQLWTIPSQGNAITLDAYGNIYVAGVTWTFQTDFNYATTKYNPNGDTFWVRIFSGSVNYSYDITSDIAVDSFLNVYVTGSNGTIKYDSAGNQLWWKYEYQCGNAMVLDRSGNILVTGCGRTTEYDPDGVQIWTDTLGGEDIASDRSGNAFVTGDEGTMKFDSNGNLLWINPEHYLSVAVDRDDYIYFSGYTGTSKYDTEGNQIWSESWGGRVALDTSRYVYVASSSYSIPTSFDYLTIKYLQYYIPYSFSLLSPWNTAILPYQVHFDWETAGYYNPLDTVRYNLYLSTSSAFRPESTIVYDSLLTSQYLDSLEKGRYYWKVWAYVSDSGRWSSQTWILISSASGDANGDSLLNVSDAVYLVNYLFKGGHPPDPVKAGDANCDTKVTIADVVFLINYLFKGGPAPNC